MKDQHDVVDVLLAGSDDADRTRTLARINANHAAQHLKIIYGAGEPAPSAPPAAGSPRRFGTAHPASDIRIFTSHRDQVTTVYVRDVVGFGAATFRAALDNAMHAGQPLLVVDLDGVSFLDRAGLDVLVGGAAQAARLGKRISVRRVQPIVYQTFVVAGLVTMLDVQPPTAR
jgi:anti-sigma B factor antagonist